MEDEVQSILSIANIFMTPTPQDLDNFFECHSFHDTVPSSVFKHITKNVISETKIKLSINGLKSTDDGGSKHL
jgi:hypothetical protein